MLEKDGLLGYRLYIRRLWQGAKVIWCHPEVTTAKRHLSVSLWAVWSGPKYHAQFKLPFYSKATGGMTNAIWRKRPFFEIAECGIFLTLFVTLVAITG